MDTKAQIRITYLDWLRALGILLVFIYHSSRLYNVEDWIVKNKTWYPGVEVWNSFATSFMMPLMFVISGASLFFAVGKGSFGKFFKGKVLRLLVPLLVVDLTHASLQGYLDNIWHGQFTGSFFQFLPHYYSLASINWLGAHMWYVLFLFVFSIILYPLLRWLKGSGQGFLSKLGGVLAKTGVLYTLTFPFLLLYVLISGDSLLMASNGGWPYIMYLWFVLLGFLIISDQRIRDKIKQMRWVSLAIGLVLVIAFAALNAMLPDKETLTPALVLLGLSRVFGSWICVLAFFGLGMQYLTERTAQLEYSDEAVLPFYILHQSVLVAVAHFVLQWGIPDVLEWAIVVVVSFIFIMVIYEYLVRRWNVTRFLFGMKRLPAQPTEGTTKPQLGGISRVG